MYIDVSNVSISFEENKEQHTILNDVSLQVEKGGIYLPARTVRLRKIHTAQCDGRIFKTFIRRDQNRRTDRRKTVHEICHHFSELWTPAMEKRAEKCRAWTGNKETRQRRKKEDHRSLPGNGWLKRSS